MFILLINASKWTITSRRNFEAIINNVRAWPAGFSSNVRYKYKSGTLYGVSGAPYRYDPSTVRLQCVFDFFRARLCHGDRISNRTTAGTVRISMSPRLMVVGHSQSL